MLNILNKLVCFCEQENVHLGSDRNKFIALICNNIAMSKSMSEHKMKKILSEYISGPSDKMVENEVVLKLKDMIQLFEEIGLSEDFLKTRKELIVKSVLLHCLGKNAKDKEKVKERLLKGLRDISFSENNPDLYEKVLLNKTGPFVENEFIELFSKVQTLKKRNKADPNIAKWIDLVVILPTLKNIIPNEEEMVKYFRYLSVFKLEDGYFSNLFTLSLKNIQKESENWETIRDGFINNLFAPGMYYSENNALIIGKIIKEYNNHESPSTIYMKNFNKNLYDFINDICNESGYMTKAISEKYKELLVICIEKDRQYIMNNLKEQSNDIYMKKRL